MFFVSLYHFIGFGTGVSVKKCTRNGLAAAIAHFCQLGNVAVAWNRERIISFVFHFNLVKLFVRKQDKISINILYICR